MGILGALSSAVSGLSAQSYALENISNNIANSQTVGYKRIETSFADLISDSPVGGLITGSGVSYSAFSNVAQGTTTPTGIPTNMALNGNGFFAVGKNDGSVTNPSFSGINQFTRRGDFKTDINGYLVNGANRYLVGTSYDPTTGAVTGSQTTPIKLPSTPLPPKPSTEIRYYGNLPSIPKPNSYNAATANSDLINPANYTTNPVTTGTVTANDQAVFLNESITGGEITLYTSSGTASTAQLRWGKTASSASGNTLQLFYQSNSKATGTQTAWQSVGSSITFDANGKLSSSTSVPITALTIDGTNVGNVNLSFAQGLTQTGDTNGQATTRVDQNGYTSGSLSSVEVQTDGTIIGSFSNGQKSKLAQVTVAHFASDTSLRREDGGTFSATGASGAPTYGLNGSSIAGGSVEASNTDISDEFSKMIVTQQAYSANTRVLTTAQTMLQDILNVIR